MLSLHSSNELDELSQWPHHNDSTINIVISVSVIVCHPTESRKLSCLLFVLDLVSSLPCNMIDWKELTEATYFVSNGL